MRASTVFVMFVMLQFIFLVAIFEDRIRDEWRQWRAETRTVRCADCNRIDLERNMLHFDGDAVCNRCYTNMW